MLDSAQHLADLALPRIVFVFGKGGVGRTTVATALALRAAEHGKRVLIVEWAVADAVGPWFGALPAGPTPVEIAPRIAVCNFSVDEALRAYFVDHLHLGFVYRRVIRARPVARMLEVAPGLAEMFFLGQLWWLTHLAEREAGLHFDRIIVDAPATGHGVSLLDIPATLAGLPAEGLLVTETARVASMLADPAQLGAIVVGLPEPLVVDETVELVDALTRRLARPPLGIIVNRSATTLADADPHPAWLDALALSPDARAVVSAVHDELRERSAVERDLRARIACPTVSIVEMPGRAPLDIARAAAHALEAA